MAALIIQECAGVGGTPRAVEYADFGAFADSLKSPETVPDKKIARTLLPAELHDEGGPKELTNIARVTAMALDFDGITEEELLRVLQDDLAGLRWAAHTTFSHPEELRTTGKQRWRVWLELSTPVAASQWTRLRENFDAMLSVVVDVKGKQNTKNPNRLMFAPCTQPGEEGLFEALDWREFPQLCAADPLDVTALDAMPAPSLPPEANDWVDDATEPVDKDEVRTLANKYMRRSGAWDHKVGRWLKRVLKGDAFVTEQSHEPTMDLARVLAEELNHVSAEALGEFLAPSLSIMHAMYGSDETVRGFVEKVRSWRRKKAAEKKRLSDIDIPGSKRAQMLGGAQEPTPFANPAQLDGEVHEAALSLVERVLNPNYAQYWHPSGVVETFRIHAGEVCVRQETDNFLVREIMGAIPTYINAKGEEAPMTVQKAGMMVADWRPFGRALPAEPEPSRFLSDPGPCFQRLPFNLQEGETPAWDEFVSRLSSPETFKAFVWTGFEKKNKGRQVLWIKGDGEDGKSTVLSVLLAAVGAAGTTVNDATFTDRFGMATMDGKRFAVIPDCKNPKLLMQEKLRNVTSGDNVFVERKGKDGISKKLNIKLIVGSNFYPRITGARADMSRLVLLEVEASKKKDDPQWEHRLREELPAFLNACRESYAKLCPHHGKLPLDDAMRALVSEQAESYEEEFEHAFNAWFTLTRDPADKAPSGPIFKRATARGPLDMGWSQEKYEAFKSYLQRMGVTLIKTGGRRFFVGVKGKLHEEGAGPQLRAITGAK